MTDDADATRATPDPDDHVARLQAQIDAAKARRAGYRAEAAETVARGGPVPPTDEELGIIKTDETVGRIAADASQEIRSRLSRLMSRFGRGGKSRADGPGVRTLHTCRRVKVRDSRTRCYQSRVLVQHRSRRLLGNADRGRCPGRRSD